MEILLQVHTTYSCERPGAIKGELPGGATQVDVEERRYRAASALHSTRAPNVAFCEACAILSGSSA
jgi:hypothetical protein